MKITQNWLKSFSAFLLKRGGPGYIVRNIKTYKPSPLYRVYVGKVGTSKLSPISVPSYIDRSVQPLYQMPIEPISECKAAYDSFGFRIGRSPLWAVYRLQKLLNHTNTSFPFAVKIDIEGCFDNL